VCWVAAARRALARLTLRLAQGSLYIRPLLIGSGPILGLAPAPEYTFVIYASPVASYFKARGAALLCARHCR
jgi:branched-subunit amino acid aminotransferase/4-amino-4-deoxychorismate lyase